MADGKMVKGERNMLDIFADGLSNTILHNAEKYDNMGIFINKTRYVKLTNRWIVMVEEDNNDGNSKG
jgi:hypothetical protein